MEDDAGLARLLKKKLEREGYVVDVAADGREGLEMVEDSSYDVLLVDHKMPVHSGLEVIRILGWHGRLPPTIMVTGGGNEKVAVKAMKLGAADYVVKDAEGGFLELLPLVVDQVLSQARLVEEKRRAEEELRASEERYRTLTENIPVGLYRTSIAGGGRVISANQAFAKMFGYDGVGELADEPVVDYYVEPEDRTLFIEKVKAEGEVNNYELRLKHRDGYAFWGSISARAICGADGELAFLDGAVRDITERKRVEAELCESEERYRALFDRSLDWVYVHDFEGDFIDANAAALDALGYEKSELSSLNFTSLLTDDKIPLALETAKEIRETGFQKGVTEYRLRRKDGTFIYVETKASVICHDGEPYAIQGIARDITERKRTEEELRVTRDELEERVKERTAELTATLMKLGESEAKYRSVVEQTQDGIVIIQDGSVKFINRPFAQRLGCGPADMEGRDFTDFVAPSARQELADRHRRRMAGEDGPSVYESLLLRCDGHEVPVEIGVATVQYEGYPAALAVVRDLTERREQEKIVREQRWILENVLNNMSELVYIVDPDTYEVLFTNETAAEALGPELAGQPCYRAIWGLEAPCHACELERVFTGERDTYTREAFNEKSGRWLRVNAKAVPWLDGAQVCCAVATDISESKELEEEIVAHNRALNRTVRERTAALQGKNRELESFAYSVSHDLRAPLRSIEGFSRALLDDYGDRFDAEGRDFLGRIVNGAVRMDRLINDLLTYSRLGRGGVAYEVVDMNELAAAAVEELAESIKAQGAYVGVARPLPVVEGDRSLLLVVLRNLLGNAIKYRRREVPPEVKITWSEEPDKVVFAVADNGIGLDMKYQNKVFDIFQRLHPEDEYPGTGIGLASAKKVVEAHGGRIWYESEPGKGATFYFELPRKRVEGDDGGG